MAKLTQTLREFRRPKQLDLEAYLKKMMSKGLDENGHLMPDPTPIAPPVGYKKHPSMVELVRDMVRGEKLRQAALEAGAETFEESEDFDVPDEPDLASSPWENEFDPPIKDLEAMAAKAVELSSVKGAEGTREALDGPAEKAKSKKAPPAPRTAPPSPAPSDEEES